MKYTNKQGLPDFIAKALQADNYRKSGDFSATGLIKTPRQSLLSARHADDIVVDVCDNVYSALGTAVHGIFECATADPKRWLREKELIQTIGGVTVSGRPDLIDLKDDDLYDYKCTSVWSSILGGKPEWQKQLNIYRWLYFKDTGKELKGLKIIALYRDWKLSDFERDRQKNPFQTVYPAEHVELLNQPVLKIDVIEAGILNRIKKHKDAEAMSDNDLPFCSKDDRWARGECWAVIKKGGKRAMSHGVCDSKAEADHFASQQKCDTFISHRQGTNNRCEHYCPCAPFCNQWQELKKKQEEDIG